VPALPNSVTTVSPSCYRLIVTGGERYDDEQSVRAALSDAMRRYTGLGPINIVTGMLSEVDDFIYQLSQEAGIQCFRLRPNILDRRKLELYARNERLVNLGQSLLAFDDGESLSVKHLLEAAAFAELPTVRIPVKTPYTLDPARVLSSALSTCSSLGSFAKAESEPSFTSAT